MPKKNSSRMMSRTAGYTKNAKNRLHKDGGKLYKCGGKLKTKNK